MLSFIFNILWVAPFLQNRGDIYFAFHFLSFAFCHPGWSHQSPSHSYATVGVQRHAMAILSFPVLILSTFLTNVSAVRRDKQGTLQGYYVGKWRSNSPSWDLRRLLLTMGSVHSQTSSRLTSMFSILKCYNT